MTASPRRALARRSTVISFTALALAGTFLPTSTADDYSVRPGDTVSAIAERFQTTVRAIVEANNLPAGGHLIYAGERLDIPAAGRPTDRPSRTPRKISPDARRIVWHTVRPGDTATELAVRYHAWTAELIAVNGLSSGGTMRVGERLRIPVVLAALPQHQTAPRAADRRPERRSTRERPTITQRRGTQSERGLPNPSRETVRAVIAETARHWGVDPQLAMAISWQEAGWQQDHVSPANAIGAMQVLPSTGDWISDIIGRDLNLRNLKDNVTAGVVLLRQLTASAPPRIAVAGYYQGLAGVREHGMYADTKRYVRNVFAIRAAFERGNYPA